MKYEITVHPANFHRERAVRLKPLLFLASWTMMSRGSSGLALAMKQMRRGSSTVVAHGLRRCPMPHHQCVAMPTSTIPVTGMKAAYLRAYTDTWQFLLYLEARNENNNGRYRKLLCEVADVLLIHLATIYLHSPYANHPTCFQGISKRHPTCSAPKRWPLKRSIGQRNQVCAAKRYVTS